MKNARPFHATPFFQRYREDFDAEPPRPPSPRPSTRHRWPSRHDMPRGATISIIFFEQSRAELSMYRLTV